MFFVSHYRGCVCLSCVWEEARGSAKYFDGVCCLLGVWLSLPHVSFHPAGCGHVVLPHPVEMHVCEKPLPKCSDVDMLVRSSRQPEHDKTFYTEALKKPCSPLRFTGWVRDRWHAEKADGRVWAQNVTWSEAKTIRLSFEKLIVCKSAINNLSQFSGVNGKVCHFYWANTSLMWKNK